MILELSVENIAVIERAQIELGPGFTVLTGETGAGKSLLVDAIALALGGRADQDLLRAGAQKGPVNLVADITRNAAAQAICRELGLSVEDGVIYVQREITAEGRNVSRIGGKAHPVSAVRALGAVLVDLHGQHDHQALLDPSRHVEYFDLWIGDPALKLKAKLKMEFEQLEIARKALRALQQGMREREHRIDLLKFQAGEIEAVNPMVGEASELEARLAKLQHAERLTDAVQASLAALTDQEGSAEESLAVAERTIHQVVKLDSGLESARDFIQTSLATLHEASGELRRYLETLENDPVQLQASAERLDMLKRLMRKYGDDESAVLAFHQKVSEELSLLEDADASESELHQKVESLQRAAEETAAELSSLRASRTREFGHLVESEVRELAMEKAIFEVGLQQRDLDVAGQDEIQFLFSANPGEPARPLDKIASGGEMSRLMLALKVTLAGKAGVPTLIFDEIDTGLSGRAAAVVSRKLQQLGEFYQVVSISHLPQLAGRADHHFKIEKGERDGRTFTQVRPLAEKERVAEVARMLAGEEVGEMAIANARELLAGRR